MSPQELSYLCWEAPALPHYTTPNHTRAHWPGQARLGFIISAVFEDRLPPA